jgi:hypothetical protein
LCSASSEWDANNEVLGIGENVESEAFYPDFPLSGKFSNPV